VHVAEHDGRNVYFCSAGCRAQFERDPLAFNAPLPQP
jgi:YHS domain-containing protein